MLKKEFKCGNTVVSRDDLYIIGFITDNVDDYTMQTIACKVENSMVIHCGENWQFSEENESIWWTILLECAYQFDLPFL